MFIAIFDFKKIVFLMSVCTVAACLKGQTFIELGINKLYSKPLIVYSDFDGKAKLTTSVTPSIGVRKLVKSKVMFSTGFGLHSFHIESSKQIDSGFGLQSDLFDIRAISMYLDFQYILFRKKHGYLALNSGLLGYANFAGMTVHNVTSNPIANSINVVNSNFPAQLLYKFRLGIGYGHSFNRWLIGSTLSISSAFNKPIYTETCEAKYASGFQKSSLVVVLGSVSMIGLAVAYKL